jgi:hypothetical protein
MRSTWRLLPIALGLVVPGVAGAHGKAGVCSLLTVSDKAAAIARLTQVVDGLKAKGWTQQREVFGSYRCSLVTPPATQSSMPNMTGCMGEAKGQGISVGCSSGTTKLPIARGKTLFDKATARID